MLVQVTFQPRPKAAIQKHSRGTSDATTKIGSQARLNGSNDFVFARSFARYFGLAMVSKRGYQLGIIDRAINDF